MKSAICPSYEYTPEDFVFAWETSKSPQEAADKLSAMCRRSVPKGAVTSRAGRYRREGVKLKSMRVR
jgi:hypothetical protein